MKTERVTLLTTPEFKDFLAKEARREGVSVAELVRSRCEGRQGAEEAMLVALTAELHEAIRQAKVSLKRGLDEANAVMAGLRKTDPAARARVARRRKAVGAGA